MHQVSEHVRAQGRGDGRGHDGEIEKGTDGRAMPWSATSSPDARLLKCARSASIVAVTLSTADEKHQEFGAGVFYHLADRVVHESVKNIDRNHPHFAVASAFGRQIN